MQIPKIFKLDLLYFEIHTFGFCLEMKRYAIFLPKTQTDFEQRFVKN